MALFHLSVTQTKRSAGQSAIASAAYRAGERLYSEYYGEYSDYTRKGGVICSDILLPSHAPPEYADRQTLWNAVEKAERGKNAQLAYSFDIALQNEFSLEENIALARQFLLENFVSRGMVVDFAVHQPDREDGGIPNPHFHVLCPIRPIEQNGKWGLKQRRVYELDEDGNRIRDANGKYIDNRIVCYDIKQLGKQLKKLGMLIVQDQVWGRVTANRSVGKSTRYYADEFHLLLKDEQTAAYSVEIWKRFRKWGGIPTALTQNVKDLLASPEVSNIFENSDFVYMLNQANGDRQILAKQLNISPHQLSYVTHSGEGEGLLFFGNVILPFVDRFPTDLELYRIMTTKLGEVSEGAQK